MDLSRIHEIVLESIAEAVYIRDRDMNILYINPASEQLTGWSLEEAKGMKCYEIFGDEQVRCREVCPAEKAIAERIHILHHEGSLKTRSGKIHEMQVSVSPIDGKRGIAGAAVIMEDITRLKEVEKTRAKTVIALQKEVERRKRAEEALRASEQRFRAIFENISLGVSLIDLDHNIIVANAAFGKWFEKPPSELTGKKCFQEFEKRESVCPHCPGARSIATGQAAKAEIEVTGNDGARVDIRIRAFPTIGPDGVVTGFIEVAEDITERKRAGEALRKSEERLELALQGANLGLWDWYVQAGLAVTSQRSAELMGYSLDGIEQSFDFWASLLHPDDRQRALEKVSDHLAGVTDYYEDEYRVRHKSGDWKWILSRGKVTERDPDGKPLRMTGTYLDITERRTAEDALKFEREQLLSLFESINEVIVVIDPLTYKILFANKFTESLYEKKLIGGTCYEKIREVDTPCGHCLNEKILALQGKPYQWEYSNAILKKDFLATDRIIRWSDGRHVKFQIAVDVTERKEAAREQEQLRAQLFQAQKMESIGTLAGGIAHDFNNLLTVVLGFSELLLTGKDERDPAYEDLQKIHQAARSGADLVRRILAFSRKAEINPRPLNLNHEIAQTKELLTRTLQKMIEVKLVLSDELPSVNADPVQIEQILMNLAVNAGDAMLEGGKLTIETKPVTLDNEYCRLHLGAEQGDYVMITVSDTGQGMDGESLHHIFEPFYTTKERGKGTGLGLAMVYGIVKQHSGYITCSSEPGMGTTFKIYVPVIPTEAKSEILVGKPTLSRGTETILLVDDEEMVRDLGKRILERSGYKVLTAANGREALDIYAKEANTISLVILDLIMPEMGGKQSLEGLRKINPHVKVLIASGYAAAGETKKTIESEAGGFVRKPYQVRGLLQAVRRVLDA